MTDHIGYNHRFHKAVCTMISDILRETAETGLRGAHHFYIRFSTLDPLCQIPDQLRAKNPEEMTIILQSWFEDLRVEDAGFYVTLNFSDELVALYVPFRSLLGFADPSVGFEIGFAPQKDDAGQKPRLKNAQDATLQNSTRGAEAPLADKPKGQTGNVIALDKMRK